MIQLLVVLKVFHPAISKSKFGVQDVIFFRFFQPILDFKHSSNVEMSLEE